MVWVEVYGLYVQYLKSPECFNSVIVTENWELLMILKWFKKYLKVNHFGLLKFSLMLEIKKLHTQINKYKRMISLSLNFAVCFSTVNSGLYLILSNYIVLLLMKCQ